MRLEDFPNIYSGEKNCFDCQHFKIKIPVQPNGLIKYIKGKARCTKGFLLREPHKKNSLFEPRYSVFLATTNRLKDGWRHEDWNAANICDDFEDMRGEDEEERVEVEESAEIPKEVFDRIKPFEGSNPKLMCISTPRSEDHWLKELFSIAEKIKRAREGRE